MNLYFLVEGKRCERKLYPAWLAQLAPHLTRVQQIQDVTTNCYYLISGEGYPSLLDVHLANAIQDVEQSGQFDLLVVVLDSDEDDWGDREEIVRKASASASPPLTQAKLVVVVQHRCLETWLLGNRRIFVRNPQSPELRRYIEHYNVCVDDPEAMPNVDTFATHAQFHHDYLRRIFQERNISYTKSRPGAAASQAYLAKLIERTEENPTHLRSFASFLALCESCHSSTDG